MKQSWMVAGKIFLINLAVIACSSEGAQSFLPDRIEGTMHQPNTLGLSAEECRIVAQTLGNPDKALGLITAYIETEAGEVMVPLDSVSEDLHFASKVVPVLADGRCPELAAFQFSIYNEPRNEIENQKYECEAKQENSTKQWCR